MSNKEKKEEIIETSEEKEEVVEEPKEKKKTNPLIPVVAVLGVAVVLLLGYLILIQPSVFEKEKDTTTEEKENNNSKETKENNNNNNTDENESKPKHEEKGSPALAIGNTKRIGIFDDDLNLLWSYDTDDYIPFADIAVDGNYIYYGVHRGEKEADLYRVNIEKREVENLDMRVNELWYIMAENNIVIYDSLYDFYQLDINTKNKTHLDIYSDNKNALINGTLFYKKKDEGSLNAYNLQTKNIQKIDDNARIVATSKTAFLYVNSENKYYLYDAKTGEKTYIKTGGPYAASGEDTGLFLYNSTVYTVKENTIYTISNEETKEVYKMSLKSDESISGIVPLNKNKFLVYKYIDNGPPCTSDTCGPTGETKNLILNIKTDNVKEVGNEDWTNASMNLNYIN